MSTISRGAFKDQEALILENSQIRAVLLPSWGAKTASLVHKGLGIETLWQNPAAAFKGSGYGEPYGDGEFAGFDEMFPTISRCFYEAAPWAGVEAPDHGEVWTIPWETSIEGDSATLSVGGTRFPYRLQKTVSLQGERLIARYAATNLSSFPLDFIWAAHPLFNATEGMRFLVPRGMRKIVNAVPGPTLGGYGQWMDFPVARRADGKEVRLDRVPARNTAGYQKYWFAEKVTEGWCMVRDDKSALTIGMAFPREKVPYLGMWLNEGGYAGQYNIAPEPATAAMDRIDFAKSWGMDSVLPPGSRLEWHLVIALASGKEPLGMSPSGELVY
jgi:galactose mutarotase-like enzyme